MTPACRLALRDLRGGLRGLHLLAVCLFLGVATLAGIGSLSAALRAELATQGRIYLGGDIQAAFSQRRATADELRAIRQLGNLSESARMNAILARPDGTRTALASLKAVDRRYPLTGRLRLAAGALPPRPDGMLLDPALAERLGVRVGDRLRAGEALFTVAGLIADEPDRLGEGFRFAPTAIIPLAALDRTGLVQPGSLYDWRYRVALQPGSDAAALAERLKARLTRGDVQLRDSSDSAPGTRRWIDQIGQFLTLVGLAALVISGIGIGNGVTAWLEGKRGAIATLKSLGATSAIILRIHLIEIAIVSAGAIIAALAIGAAVPMVVSVLAGAALPIAIDAGLHPVALALAATYGVLVAFAFALPPLARARRLPAASLFRGAAEAGGTPRTAIAVSAGFLLAAALLAIATARQPVFAAAILAATAATTAALMAIARIISMIAARFPRPRRPLLRLAIANLHAPGAQTERLVLALGLGLTLFATLASIQANLSGALRDTVPRRAPSFFVLDIPSDGLNRFVAAVERVAPGARIETVPSLRGPIVALGNRRVADMRRIPEGAWILRGDRGLTFAAALPEGNSITAGRWWPRDYAGPPLVSIDAEAGRILGLKVGDSITVSVLGVEVPATIASFRRIEWRTMGFNFALIFSPHSFDGAPFNYMATLDAPVEREDALNRAVTLAFPSSSLIRVRDVIGEVSRLFGQLATAVAIAASVAIASGIAVLVGAVLAVRRARSYDAVLLKLLGATRRQILLVQAFEYAGLAVVVAFVALGAGMAGGYYVVARLFELPWTPAWPAVLATLGTGMALILLIGLAGSLPVLAVRPAQALRTL